MVSLNYYNNLKQLFKISFIQENCFSYKKYVFIMYQIWFFVIYKLGGS